MCLPYSGIIKSILSLLYSNESIIISKVIDFFNYRDIIPSILETDLYVLMTLSADETSLVIENEIYFELEDIFSFTETFFESNNDINCFLLFGVFSTINLKRYCVGQ